MVTVSNDEVMVEEGIDIAEAWGLDVPPVPERQIDKLLIQIGEDLNELDELANETGAEKTAEAVKKYRKELVDLTKKASKHKKEKKLVAEAVKWLLAIRAELSVPAREQGVNDAVAKFRRDAGPLGKSKAAEFEKQRDKIAKEKDPLKRCEQYFELEREIIKADLYFQEQADPGSTWLTQVEFAVEDAVPHEFAKEGAKSGAWKGFKSPLPGGLIGGAISGAISGLLEEHRQKNPLTADEWRQMGEAFAAAMNKRIADMAFSVPEDSLEEFTAEAKRLVKEIQDEHFAADRLPDTQVKLGRALMLANTAALQQLGELKREYPADTTPQVFVQNGKLTVAKHAPKLESLVLQGGGGKGVGYPAILEEMNSAGMLENVDLLVGTSIGALNASCLACGGLQDEREILNLSLSKQAFDVPGFKKKYPGVKFGKDVFPTCAGEMAKMDELTSMSVTEKLKTHSEQQLVDDLVDRLGDLDDDTLERLGLKGADDETIAKEVQKLAQKVKHQDYGASDRTSQMITFKDLAILHQLDPKNFKELTITGWEGTGTDGRSVYFNAKDFPDMPIALAARISMGLPIFSPVYWNGRGPFYDGGIGSNAPTEATPGLDKFYNEHQPADAAEVLKGDDIPVEVQEAMQKTMLMTFDEEGTASDKLHGQGRMTAAPNMGEKVTVLKQKQIGDPINPDYGGALKRDATKVYNSGVNTFQVFHGNQGTMSLGVLGGTPEEIEYAENLSRMKALEQIDQRADQAVAVSCNTADEALSTFSDDEKRKFVQAGLPDNADPLVKELFDKCQAYLALDQSCQAAKGSGDSTSFLNDLVSSDLTADCQTEANHLRDAYNVCVAGSPSPDVMKNECESSKAAIQALPSYLRPMLKATVLVPLQKKVRALGKVAPDEPPPSFLWKKEFSAKAFEQSVKGASKAGVFPYAKEAEKVYDALKSYVKHDDKLQRKKKDKDRVKQAREVLNRIDDLLRRIKAMAESTDYAANETMRKYLAWLTERADSSAVQPRRIVKGGEADFPKNSFLAWNNKDWQKNKKGAIDAGALEDPGATGLGDAMQDAVKAAATHDKAGDADTKLSAGKSAWRAWDQVIRAAKGVQTWTENANFRDYMEDCVTKATAERNKYPSP